MTYPVFFAAVSFMFASTRFNPSISARSPSAGWLCFAVDLAQSRCLEGVVKAGRGAFIQGVPEGGVQVEFAHAVPVWDDDGPNFGQGRDGVGGGEYAAGMMVPIRVPRAGMVAAGMMVSFLRRSCLCGCLGCGSQFGDFLRLVRCVVFNP